MEQPKEDIRDIIADPEGLATIIAGIVMKRMLDGEILCHEDTDIIGISNACAGAVIKTLLDRIKK